MSNETVSAPQQPATAAPASPRRSGKALLIAVLCGVLLIAFVIWNGLRSRAEASTQLRESTQAQTVLPVAVTHPVSGAPMQELVEPGTMQAYIDTPIWARASGYLKHWYVDIGGRVHQGQLLADIESPETDQQLQQAREDLSTAQANLKLAQITAERYNNLFKTDSVAKQDVDNAVQDAAAKTATVSGAQANVRRLEQLVSYEKVIAPFDGVVTQRNVDVGSLIDAGANTPGKELFHLASISTLRVYVNVPETYERSAKPGVHAAVTLNEFPGRQFDGIIVRNSNSIDPVSRTLLVEVDVRNPTGELLPGSYASVHLKLPVKIQTVTVPANCLMFRAEGLRVALVRNGHAALVPVTISHDYGETVEIPAGLTPQDSVIVNPSDSILDGQAVQVTGTGA